MIVSLKWFYINFCCDIVYLFLQSGVSIEQIPIIDFEEIECRTHSVSHFQDRGQHFISSMWPIFISLSFLFLSLFLYHSLFSLSISVWSKENIFNSSNFSFFLSVLLCFSVSSLFQFKTLFHHHCLSSHHWNMDENLLDETD